MDHTNPLSDGDDQPESQVQYESDQPESPVLADVDELESVLHPEPNSVSLNEGSSSQQQRSKSFSTSFQECLARGRQRVTALRDDVLRARLPLRRVQVRGDIGSSQLPIYISPHDENQTDLLSAERRSMRAYADRIQNNIYSQGDMINNRYMINGLAGYGSFGHVYRAFDTTGRRQVAIKITRPGLKGIESGKNEWRLLYFLNGADACDEHHITRISNHFILQKQFFLVFDQMEESLHDYLRRIPSQGLPLGWVSSVSKQVLQCLSFLSRRGVGITHGNLSPSNILITNQSTVRVAGFGWASNIAQLQSHYAPSGYYCPPEVLLGFPCSSMVDVWSMGCILLELHCGRNLFAGRNDEELVALLVKRLGYPPAHMLQTGSKSRRFFEPAPTENATRWRLKPSIPIPMFDQDHLPLYSVRDFVSYWSRQRGLQIRGLENEDFDFFDLVSRMLEYDPSRRITASEALRHPFFSGRPASSISLHVRGTN